MLSFVIGLCFACVFVFSTIMIFEIMDQAADKETAHIDLKYAYEENVRFMSDVFGGIFYGIMGVFTKKFKWGDTNVNNDGTVIQREKATLTR